MNAGPNDCNRRIVSTEVPDEKTGIPKLKRMNRMLDAVYKTVIQKGTDYDTLRGLISTGYTPATFTLDDGQTYGVGTSDYGNLTFDPRETFSIQVANPLPIRQIFSRLDQDLSMPGSIPLLVRYTHRALWGPLASNLL